MAISEQDRTSFEAQLPPNVPIDRATIFSGLKKKSDLKRTVQFVTNAGPFLQQVFRDGEQLRAVAFGLVNHTWELLLGGAWAQMTNRTLIALTNQRLLLIHATQKGEPRSYLNQLELSAIKKASAGMFAGFNLKLGSGSLNIGMAKGSAKALAALIEANPQATGGRTFTCPGCFATHRKYAASCAGCSTEFKSPKVAAARSMLLPGLGDWYLGHRFLAGLEMAGALLGWVVIGAMVVLAIQDGEAAVGIIIGVVLLGFINGGDALLTYFQAKEGMMSADGGLPAAQSGVSTAVGTAPPPMYQ